MNKYFSGNSRYGDPFSFESFNRQTNESNDNRPLGWERSEVNEVLPLPSFPNFIQAKELTIKITLSA
jgi:hypothetical protein